MRTLLMGLISAAALAVDQVSKRLIEGTIEPYTSVNVLSNFDLVHTSNRGMSFGLFASDSPFSPYILSFIGLCIIVFLGVWAFRSDSAVQRAALALIIGGAASNVLDRLDDGAVTDFLDFYIGAYHWPAFNLADAAIVCGVAALLLETSLPPAFRKKEHTR